jgi:hypothetical protein
MTLNQNYEKYMGNVFYKHNNCFPNNTKLKKKDRVKKRFIKSEHSNCGIIPCFNPLTRMDTCASARMKEHLHLFGFRALIMCCCP